jgi:nitroreductase
MSAAHPAASHAPPVKGRQALLRLVEYALLAPSAYNTQPWAFAVGDHEIRVYVDRDRWLRVADPDERDLYVSVGCALENLLIAAARFGHAARVWYEDEERADGLAAVIRLRGGTMPSRQVRALFDAIPLRQTNRRRYDGRPLAHDVLDALQAAVAQDGIQLRLILEPDPSRRLQELLALAECRQMSDPLYRRELAEWVGQGAWADGWLRSRAGRVALRHLDLGRSRARRDTARVRSAPAVGVLTSLADDRASQMRAGRAFERLALTATARGVAVQPLSALLALPLTRAGVAQLVPDVTFPQHVFRLGYAQRERRHSPRRRLADVLRPENASTAT